MIHFSRIYFALKVSCALTLLSACNTGEEVTKELEKRADEVCTCATAECANTAYEGFADYYVDNKDVRMNDENSARAGGAYLKANDCLLDKGGDPARLQELVDRL